MRTAVGHQSVDPEKLFPHLQVLVRILTGDGIHILQPGCEKNARWHKDFGDSCMYGLGSHSHRTGVGSPGGRKHP